jgi:cystathionine beta-lyase
MRSMGARLKQQERAALDVVRWLQGRSEVKRVLYPALEGDPGHHLWQRDFSGASSLFGVLLHETSEEAVARMVDNYSYFRIGASWGGFESLVIPADPAAYRTAPPWDESGYLLRYHIGLEDPQDLISDLTDGFKRLG